MIARQEERRMINPPRHNDVRSEWERDMARLIHSSAFRRLQSKTQVLGLGESDFYRTRLTHSMEVAQIGTGILRFLKEKYRKENEVIFNTLPDHNLMMAICLAHDIGHPPFGHGGEVALNFCMKSNGGFEGNGQTLRILAKLDKYTESHGLNPTRRMLLGVLKYPASYKNLVNTQRYDQALNAQSESAPNWLFKAKYMKPPKCFHDAENDVVGWILEPLSDADRTIFTMADFEENDQRRHRKPKYKSLDTSIMELADDISYGIHDLEDAISLGMIDRKKWDDHFESNGVNIFQSCDLNIEDVAVALFGPSHDRKECIGNLVNLMITNTFIDSRVPAAECSLIRFNAYLTDAFETLRDNLHKLVEDYVIFNPNVQQLEFKGQRLIIELFEILATDPDRFLPERTKQRYQDQGRDIRVICDFVSGMTDDYAVKYYERLSSPRRGSIFEHL